MKLLVVEDEQKTAAYLRKGLTEQGFAVDICHDGEEGLECATNWSYDLLIIDVMLPGCDGCTLLRDIRHRGNEVPALFLSALGNLDDRVRGLRVGADDYLVKPFAFSELLARIRSILRRGPGRRADTIRVADLAIDLELLRATRGGKRLELTPKEFQLLALLARRPGAVFSRSVIVDQIWGLNFDSHTNLVDVHIRRLRSKVDDPFGKKLIYTIRGLGYVLEER